MQEVLLVEGLHPLTSAFVLDRPQTHDHGLRSSDLERAPQAEHSLTNFDLAHSGVACGQNRPVHSFQVDAGDFLSGENAVRSICLDLHPTVSTCKGEPREKERIFCLCRQKYLVSLASVGSAFDS